MSAHVTRWALLCALVLAVPAAAQRRGTIEVDALVRYTNFDNELLRDNTVGVGGRVTVYAQPALALELDLSRGSEYTPLHVRLVYHGPVGDRTDALVGGGYVRNWYGDPWAANDDGFSALLGLRRHVTNAVSLRLGFDADVMFHTSDRSPFAFYTGNWGLHFGGSVRLNGGDAQ